MPELPEVETMRRGILPIVGCRIVAAERPECRLRPILFRPRIDRFERRVRGKRVTAVRRRGKRIVIELADGQAIIIEPRMTGLLLLSDPPGREHLRLRLTLAASGDEDRDGREPPRPDSTLLFWDRRGLGTVRLASPLQRARLLDDRLGPDALSITAEELRSGLGASRRAIKVALLDQSAVAGIGNLYAAEILFAAGVDPRARCDRLSGPQWRRIHGATRAVLTEAIEHEGSTLGDGTYRTALNDPGRYQNCHRVYDRTGATCGRCGLGVIRRIVQAQRSTFFCPACQRRTGRHVSVADI